MTDNDEQAESRDPPGGALGLGERLRSARKARALSLEQVAESLHLDESIVLALEAEEFESMGAPVFVRGHLKAYARLVGLPEEAVLTAYKSADPGSEAVPRIARETDRSVTINPVTWGIWALVALLVIILAVYVLQDEEPPISVRRETTSANPDVNAAATAVPADEFAAEPAPKPEPVFEPEPRLKPEPEPEFMPVEEAEPAPEPVGTSVRLALRFERESWVEISDSNRRLLFGLQRAGSRRELVGDPPFNLLLGDSRGVELLVNGAPYSIPRRNITGKVARFEITSRDIE